jgi:hypothetical protein
MSIKEKLVSLFFLCITFNLSAQKMPVQQTHKKAKLTFTIIKAPNNTFGYNIFQNGTLLIHQPAIPALPGNNGFASKMKAIKVAKLVISKIMNGEMPPTVTEAEMKKLDAIR